MCVRKKENRDGVHVQCTTIEKLLRIYYERRKKIKVKIIDCVVISYRLSAHNKTKEEYEALDFRE
jgi:hypothetical protein